MDEEESENDKIEVADVKQPKPKKEMTRESAVVDGMLLEMNDIDAFKPFNDD